MTYRNLPKAISLALMLAASSLGPLMLPGTALAETPKEGAGSDQAAAKSESAATKSESTATKSEGAADKTAKTASKAKPKAKKATTAKAPSKAVTHAKADKTEKAAPKAKAKRTAARETKPAAKRAKAPAKADDSPKHGAAPAPCTGAAVALDRGGVEADRLPLVDCHSKPLKAAIAKVSVLARPWGAPKRAAKSSLLDGGVIARIDAIARKFSGRTISLVGGPRAATSGGSAHQSGRAVDLRVDGIDNRKLAEFCRTLPDTGCGYYPNASFVHVDVRARGSGKSSWIDVSEPGEPPRYVSAWPPEQAPIKQ